MKTCKNTAAALLFAMAVFLCPGCNDRMEEDGFPAFFPSEKNIGYELSPMSASTRSSSQVDFEDKVGEITLAAYDHSGSLVSARYFVEDLKNMKMPLANDAEYDIYALANMGDMCASFPERETDVKEMAYDIPSMAYVEENGLPMSGMLSGCTSETCQSDKVTLKRLLAKVTVHATLDYYREGDNSFCKRMAVRNLNRHLVPFGESRARSGSDIMNEDESIGQLVMSEEGETTASFYVPENMQGAIGSVVDMHGKNPDMDSEIRGRNGMLTYFTVEYGIFDACGEYSGEITYRSYLGDNAIDDFNIERNTKYLWNVVYLEDALEYSDWKVDNGVDDCRYLWFRRNPIYVEAGEGVSCADVLDYRLAEDKVEHSFSGSTSPASHDSYGITIRTDAVKGQWFDWTAKAKYNNGDGHLSDVARVIVTRKASSLTLSPNPASLERAATLQLRALAAFSSGTEDVASDPDCVFEVTEGTDKLSVSGDGLLTGLAVGTATVKATYTYQTGLPPVTAECVVTVLKPAVKSLLLTVKEFSSGDGKSVTGYVGFDVALRVRATLNDGTYEEVEGDLWNDVTWTSSDVSTAVGVSSDGCGVLRMLTPAKRGVTVKAKYGGKTSGSLTVNTCSVVMDPEEGVLPLGTSLLYKASRVTSSGTATSSVLGTWSVDAGGESVATVDASGLVQSTGRGNATVRNSYLRTDGGWYDITGNVNVEAPVVTGGPTEVTAYDSPETASEDYDWAVILTPASSEVGADAGSVTLASQGSHKHRKYSLEKFRYIYRYTWSDGSSTWSARNERPYEGGTHYSSPEAALAAGAWIYDSSRDRRTGETVTTVTTDPVTRSSGSSWITEDGVYQKNTGVSARTATLTAVNSNSSIPESLRPVSATATVLQAGNALSSLRLCALDPEGAGEITARVEYGHSIRIGAYAEYTNGDSGYCPVSTYGDFSLAYASGAPAYFGSIAATARTLTANGSGYGLVNLKGTMTYGGVTKTSTLGVTVFRIAELTLSPAEFDVNRHAAVQLQGYLHYSDGTVEPIPDGKYRAQDCQWSCYDSETSGKADISSTGVASTKYSRAQVDCHFCLSIWPYRDLGIQDMYVVTNTGHFHEDVWLTGGTVRMSENRNGWITDPIFEWDTDPATSRDDGDIIVNAVTALCNNPEKPEVTYVVYPHEEQSGMGLASGTGKQVYNEMYVTHPYSDQYPYGGLKSFTKGKYGKYGVAGPEVTVESQYMKWYPGM